MNTQPNALRLADAMWEKPNSNGDCLAASKELRRLHALNQELLEALKLACPIIEHNKFLQDCSYGHNFSQTKADRARLAFEKSRAAIAKAEAA